MLPLLPLIGASIALGAAIVGYENSREDLSDSRQTYDEIRRTTDQNLKDMRRRNKKAQRVSNY